jgi:hypothetical protein
MSFLKNIFTSLLRIHSSFLHIFYFSKYFESVNSKIADFEIWWRPNPSNFSKFRYKIAKFVKLPSSHKTPLLPFFPIPSPSSQPSFLSPRSSHHFALPRRCFFFLPSSIQIKERSQRLHANPPVSTSQEKPLIRERNPRYLRSCLPLPSPVE